MTEPPITNTLVVDTDGVRASSPGFKEHSELPADVIPRDHPDPAPHQHHSSPTHASPCARGSSSAAATAAAFTGASHRNNHIRTRSPPSSQSPDCAQCAHASVCGSPGRSVEDLVSSLDHLDLTHADLDVVPHVSPTHARMGPPIGGKPQFSASPTTTSTSPFRFTAAEAAADAPHGFAQGHCRCFDVPYKCSLCALCTGSRAHTHGGSTTSSDSCCSGSTLACSSVASSAATPREFASTRATSPIPSLDEHECDEEDAIIVCEDAQEDELAAEDGDRCHMPRISLEALEAEIQQKYGLSDKEEADALRANQLAVERQCREDRMRAKVAAARPAACPLRRCSKTGANVFSWDEIRRHASAESCWLVVRGVVYDVTPMLSTHPAGIKSILRNGGTEATEHFDFHSGTAHKLWKTYEIGLLEGYQHSRCTIM